MDLNIDIRKIYNRIISNLNPKNIWQKIVEMPLMNKVYYSKIGLGFILGLIFGLTNFVNWPAVLTMLGVFVALSSTWTLLYRNKEQGIKIRSYYTSAMFQFFITCVAVWTLFQNLLYIPPSDWVF